MVCDFCSSPHVATAFHANSFHIEPFDVGPFHQMSEGDWASCPLCAEFVVTKDWNGLARRVAETMLQVYPDLPADVGELQDQFFVLYAGLLAGELTGKTDNLKTGGMN